MKFQSSKDGSNFVCEKGTFSQSWSHMVKLFENFNRTIVCFCVTNSQIFAISKHKYSTFWGATSQLPAYKLPDTLLRRYRYGLTSMAWQLHPSWNHNRKYLQWLLNKIIRNDIYPVD